MTSGNKRQDLVPDITHQAIDFYLRIFFLIAIDNQI